MRRSHQGGEGKPGEGALIDTNKEVGGGEGLLRPMLLREPGGEAPHGLDHVGATGDGDKSRSANWVRR